MWLLVSFVQSYHTELLADEAYYWKYAQDLAWGYFDHPPMVAVFIKAGYSLFQNELGVRLLFILSSVAMIYILEVLTQPKRLLYFYLTIASVGLFHFLSFLALPDMPLLLFSSLYLCLYKTYLNKDGFLISLMLSICIVLMLLSKYHGVLLIAFTLIANPALFKRRSFWMIAAFSIVLYLPHVYWQLQHDFPSIKYHLVERATNGYDISYSLNYLLSDILIFSPVVGIVLAWHTLRKKPKEIFERTLYLIFIGTIAFFFAMSFKGQTEANWVAITVIPAIIIGYRICEGKAWFHKLTAWGFTISIFVIGLARVLLVYDFLPNIPQLTITKATLYHTKEWAKQIEHKAGDRPVVFMNKYQYAAWYEYYIGKPAISLNNRIGRKNQYNISTDEYNIQGKDVMIVPNYTMNHIDSIATRKGIFQYYYEDNFRSSSSITIQTFKDEYVAAPSEQLLFHFQIYANDNKWDITNNPNCQPVIHVMLFKDGEFAGATPTDFYLQNEMLIFNSSKSYTTTFVAPKEQGVYKLYLDVAMCNLPPTINGNEVTLTVR